MKKPLPMILVGLLILGILLVTQFVFVVREGEVAVVTTFGRPVRDIEAPGLYTRGPWPIQAVHRFDGRVRVLEGAFTETLTADGKNVIVSMYAGWRIADPVRFLERLGSDTLAEANLAGLLDTYKNAAIGRVAFSNLVNVAPDALALDTVEAEVLANLQPQTTERYGIETAFVGLRRIGLPESITLSVFERMRSERRELAERYRSEGEGAAIRIRAEADAEADRLLSLAEADATRLRAEGEAAAAETYRVFAEDPDLAVFLKKLDVLQDTLSERATVILSGDTPPFDLLQPDAQP